MDLSEKTEVMRKVNREVYIVKRNVYFKLQRELQNFYKELKDSILSIATDIEVKMKKHNILHLFAKITL